MKKNLVFAASAFHSIAYWGALKYLEETKKMKAVVNCLGSSAGALIAFFISLGFSSEEVIELIKQNKMVELFDSKYMHSIILSQRKNEKIQGISRVYHFFNRFKDFKNLYKNMGLNSGNALIHSMRRRLKTQFKDPCLTFEKLHQLHQKEPHKYKNLFLLGTNLETGLSEEFSFLTTPKMEIVIALRISLSEEFLFSPYPYNQTLYVDGAYSDVYPIHFFDKPMNVKGFGDPLASLGFYTTSESHLKYLQTQEREHRPFSFKQKGLWKLFALYKRIHAAKLKAQERLIFNQKNLERTICIPITKDISINKAGYTDLELEKLCCQGYLYAKKYFDER